MRMRILAPVGLLVWAAVAYAQSQVQTQTLQPLNAMTGLWQMSMVIAWTGLPPQLQAAMSNGQPRNYQSCVKSQDLSSNPWEGGSGQHCTWNVVRSNGSDMELQGTNCDMGKDLGMTAAVHGTIHVSDPQDGTGSFDITLTGNGQTMQGHASYTGKWLSASCPAQ